MLFLLVSNSFKFGTLICVLTLSHSYTQPAFTRTHKSRLWTLFDAAFICTYIGIRSLTDDYKFLLVLAQMTALLVYCKEVNTYNKTCSYSVFVLAS